MSGIVLCGGRSTRMGQSKATLPFGPEPMVCRVVRLLAEAVDPIVVVAAADQPLPELPEGLTIARDRRPERGPLEGLAVGLAALRGRTEAAYATSCDVPLLAPALVRRMIELLEDHDVAVPVEGKFHHPLAAVYHVRVLPKIEQLLAADRLRPVYLFDEVNTRRVPVESLRDVDPTLATLTNCNRPKDYRAALATAGFDPPEGL